MTVYALAQLAIHDRDRYQRYVDAFMPVITRYGGRVLAVDDHARVLEGEWPFDRVVLMAFPDEDSFTQWSTSPEYREIAVDRQAATTGPVVLIHAPQGS